VYFVISALLLLSAAYRGTWCAADPWRARCASELTLGAVRVPGWGWPATLCTTGRLVAVPVTPMSTVAVLGTSVAIIWLLPLLRLRLRLLPAMYISVAIVVEPVFSLATATTTTAADHCVGAATPIVEAMVLISLTIAGVCLNSRFVPCRLVVAVTVIAPSIVA
jgi:hypothetical protein